VTTALVGADLDLATDVGGHLATEVTLGLVVGLDPVTQGDELVVVQLVDTRVPADPRVLQGLQSAGVPHAVDVGEGDLEALVAREVDPDQASHR
jgi:hypothetical protein